MNSKYKIFIALALILGLVRAEDFPAKLELIGTLRDFANVDSKLPEAHPDFNAYLGDDREIVTVDLGMDDKPVYNSAVTHPTITSEDSFKQWYRTDPNPTKPINKEFPYTLVLNHIGNGVYSYDNPSFFPLDGQGFGNEDKGRNFGFTLEIHTKFTYKKGQNFAFRGDDDLWVFINKKRVIDLGGVHGAEDASINLDTLSLTEGNDYDLDIFFAERHVTESNFKITTSILLKPSCSAPQIYNPTKNSCDDCTKPSVYLNSIEGCGTCTAPKVHNPATYTCDDCVPPKIYDSSTQSCGDCPKGKVYIDALGGCGTCTAPKVYNAEKRSCEDCPAPKAYNPSTQKCEYCVDPKVYIAATKTCELCSAPKVYNPIKYTCEKCPYPEFYNFDGTCIPDCPKELRAKQEGTDICKYPCTKTQIYQVKTKKCRCDCPMPGTKKDVNGYKVCVEDIIIPL